MPFHLFAFFVESLCQSRRQLALMLRSALLPLLLLIPMAAVAMNTSPVVNTTPPTAVDEDAFYTYTIAATDAEGDALTYSAVAIPPWLTFNTGSASLFGTPLNADVGIHTVTLRVSDGVASVEQQFSISVGNINDPPTLLSNIPNLTLLEDNPFTLDLSTFFEDVDGGDLLLFSAVDLPTGMAVSPLGELTGAPTNQDAIDSPFNVTVTVADLAKTTASSFFQIQVININDAPTPANDMVTLSEDTNTIIDVLANDVDVDDVLLPSTVFVTIQPLHGSATVNTSTGLITYTPVANYAGADSFEYRITDPLGTPGTAMVDITVLPVNDPPVAQNDVITTSEDTAIDIDVLANDTDPDIGDAPQGTQLIIEVPPNNGAVAIVAGQVRYTPNMDFNGTDSFQYKAADLNGAFTNNATVTISVGAINDLPVAGDDIANTAEDTPVEFVVINNDSDTEDGSINPATIFIINQPTNGSAALNAGGTITYTPDPNFNGNDSLQYTVRDSDGFTSNAATVLLSISPVNDTPVANSDLVAMAEDTVLDINVLGNDVDIDGNNTIDAGSVNITIHPGHGAVFVDTVSGVVQYTPDADYFGSDTFNYNIRDDGNLVSADANVLITISPVNDAPRLVDDSANTDEDNAITINILDNDADVDGTLDLTSLAFTQFPVHGTVSFNSFGQVVYTPELNYHGNDLFSYTIKDNNGLVADIAAAVLLTINSVNDAPGADNNDLVTREDKQLTFTLTGSDVDGDALGFVITRPPAHGTLSGSGATRIYTPDENYNGPDDFDFQTTDGFLNSTTANITLTVIPVNDRPLATAQTVTLNEDSAVNIVLGGTDIDSTELTFTLAGGELSGTITGIVPNLTYTPAENFNGEEKLLFFANDGELDSGINVITIQVLAVNDIPTVSSQDLFLAEDGSIAFLLEGEDIDGDHLNYVIGQSPLHGVISGTPPNLIYTPDADYFGSDSLTFVANDGNVSSALGTVNFSISPNDDAPTATGQTVSGDEDSDIPVTLQGNDPDGNPLTYQIVIAPLHGSLEGTPPNMVYRGGANFNGSDSLRFKVSDGSFESADALVTINVNPVNDAPIANDDVFSLSMAGLQWLTLDVLANDIDIDGDTLTLLSAQTDFGTVAVHDNQLRYVPQDGFAGKIFIHYLMADPSGDNASARVELTVLGDGGSGGGNGSVDPLITPPANINVVADGRLTRVNLGVATAVDALGNMIPVSLLNDDENFSPGAHTVFWQAIDSQGNSAIASQQVNIFPQVSLSPSQQVAEGSNTVIRARLNGPAPAYPIVIPYTVSGDALPGIDYELPAGEIRFNQGTEAELILTTLADELAEPDESVIIELGDTPYKNNQSTHTVHITEGNIAPRLMLQSWQGGQPRFLLEQIGGPVTVMATLTDGNAGDSHTLSWQPGPGVVRGNLPDEDDFVFSIQDMLPGVYQIAATVSDDGTPALTAQQQIYLEVTAALPALGNGDSDGDLFSDAVEGYRDSDGDHIADYLDPINDCRVVPQRADEPQHFLLEGQSGGCLRRGRFTAGNDSGGIMLDENTDESPLPADPDTTNVGGLFDFEVHHIGYSQGNGEDNSATDYHVVIAQRQPLPADAVYRKYSPAKGWYTFVENEHNRLWSAPGSAGVCPPPKDDRWQSGLHQGHWCVQLAIEDGGANDNDGLVNQSITDPGGIAVYNSSNQFPVAEPDVAEVLWNTTTVIEVLENDSDPDNDSLVIINAQAQLGSAQIIDDTTISYQTPENYIGDDVVSYSISDGHGGIAGSTLTVTVKGNNAPVAENDSATTDADKPFTVNVLANDSDADGDPLTITAATADSGTVAITADNLLLYTPDPRFEGTVTVSYQISDPAGAIAQGQLFIVVSQPAVNEPEPPTDDDNGDSGGGGSLGYWLLLLGALVITRQRWVRKRMRAAYVPLK